MVQMYDFDLRLVSAEETKTQFKEHEKAGKVYVEVEPGAEYFISMQKIRVSTTDLYCKFSVDGKDLGYYCPLGAASVNSKPSLHGVFSRVNGVTSDKALMFVKAMFSRDATISNGGPAMGQVKLDVYQAVYQGQTHAISNYSSSFSAATIDPNQSAMAKKKGLRSGEGKSVITKTTSSAIQNSYAQGAFLYSITLNYCAAVGLIHVGVLPKPPLWAYHRMLHPAKPGDAATTGQDGKVRAKRTSDGKEVLDLAGGDESSDDDGEVGGAGTENAPQKKKAKAEPGA